MTKEVETIHAHYQRQATPEVWSEVDALRRQVEELTNIIGWCRRRLPPRMDTYVDEMLAAAQAIEAQRAETTGSVHESPVPEGNAPTPGQSDNQQEDK